MDELPLKLPQAVQRLDSQSDFVFIVFPMERQGIPVEEFLNEWGHINFFFIQLGETSLKSVASTLRSAPLAGKRVALVFEAVGLSRFEDRVFRIGREFLRRWFPKMTLGGR